MSTVPNQPAWENFSRRFDRSVEPNDDALQATDELYRGFMDDVASRLRSQESTEQQVNQTLEELFQALLLRRCHSTEDEWRRFIKVCRRHPLRLLVHEDPFTYRAFSKPRSYAGDAVMMDYIYGREELWPEPPASRVGQRVFRYTTNAPASEGVRARRGYVAELLDQIAGTRPQAEVLAIASGHLREACMSSAVRRRKLSRYLALDADPLSLREVERSYGGFGVETVSASIRQLLTNRLDVGTFDLVYSTGLFDYLKPNMGQRLVLGMFNMLKPGGRLMVANFLPGVHDIGYMEAFMDWFLIYRDRREMVELTTQIPEEEVHDIRLISIENKNIICLEVTRAF